MLTLSPSYGVPLFNNSELQDASLFENSIFMLLGKFRSDSLYRCRGRCGINKISPMPCTRQTENTREPLYFNEVTESSVSHKMPSRGVYSFVEQSERKSSSVSLDAITFRVCVSEIM